MTAQIPALVQAFRENNDGVKLDVWAQMYLYDVPQRLNLSDINEIYQKPKP